ncbi:glucosamine--fructose-6-phosphate aminotransferase (isomerizing) [Amycolatopsis arida]|uniref:Glutamine--fructose-6-phosphate aminotransferase [isomerizing] n=1 Tax=Amycolatopsis arida TaxID=587909 RepID=A0A1I5YGC1_9PSEU|nr:glutamine--fructose-6-phosphate transaminase (isomerizing) [Amycolatopsis arida]TDX90494.1 glucosamine--fructose-6-phosphate aminotransferase (isomerizing) [Amycolatopsis arida]SFQ43269.1 glucosamine--fructose-6-phosphate aminotransferase (isomerizing) [Amycolatopsis arida]
MCGIVGYIGTRPAGPILLEGLHRLEYRGYDSAGLAVAHRGRLRVTKAAGRVDELRAKVADKATRAPAGIAHTRWATHGEPTDVNAHPHVDATNTIAVVHNGILENADHLRAKLTADGVELASDTDTETLAHLVAAARADTDSLEDAVRAALRGVEGAYGIVVLDARDPGELVVARNGSPIVLGIGDGEMFVASDVAALVRHTQRVVYLDDGELATLTANDYRTSTAQARRTAKTPTTVDVADDDYQLGDHPDFMRKEMHEQPEAVRRALMGRLDERFATAHLGGVGLDPHALRSVRRVKFLGCGSAYYAGQLGANLVEELARLPADAEPASEFRYRNPVVDPDTLHVAVSQSGETLDTLAAVQELQRKGGRVIGVVNVVGSAIARECGSGVFLHAGPEVSVASTKAFTNMSVCFAMLALLLGRVRDLSVAHGRRIVAALDALPDRIAEVLATEDEVARVAARFSAAEHMFFIGRVRGWPVAREGAQKLKEISYVHAEAYQAAELKHGPLALIDERMPSVVLVPDDELVSKNIGAIEQIRARGGPVIAVTNTKLPDGLADAVLTVPRTEPELDPILLTVPLQLFAYHLAARLGRDIDKPRNLAKSVTVE